MNNSTGIKFLWTGLTAIVVVHTIMTKDILLMGGAIAMIVGVVLLWMNK